ncbi:MAG: right-handed parallel beta-helix repeat-containing protein [Methanobrevibacter thaueri]|nr:right-handed parallel beta-helix repeat-containing protein [Methanobrevibacter thaueri]
MIIITAITISAVSANDSNLTIETTTNNTNISTPNHINNELIKIPDVIIPDNPDTPDLIVNETYYVHQNDIDDYFNNGILNPKYANKTLIFTGNFQNIGKLTINTNNVTIIGSNSYLKNTVFNIQGNDVTLSNLNIDLDSKFESNDYAGIFISSDNVVLSNLNINYIVPTNTEAYAIYAVGNSKKPSKNLKIINSNIYFEGHNNDYNVYDNAVKILYYKNSLMDNNTIITSLPLKNVNHGSKGATLDSEFVLTVGFENCDNFIFTNNNLVSDVNKRTDAVYPTLDCLMVSHSNNCLVVNNSVYMTDFITYPGVENYLYGIDVYALNNLTVKDNTINIVTTGGKLAAGTAYPIQITGPISKVNVTQNDLYTFSNGPNIGIYSQNYYGGTELSITNNKINVTGLAGNHEWALVAGIESQDSDSYIVNNTIEVHSVSSVNENDNIYGVSYRQNINGNHTYNIQNNTVFSDGYSSVFLLSSQNSTVANNLLVTYNDKAKNGNNGFNYGDLSSQKGISFYNNKVIRAFDYFASINNNVDGGNNYNYNPVNNGISNNIDGSNIKGRVSTTHTYNPLLPGSSKQGNYEQHGQPIINPGQGDEGNNQGQGSTDSGEGDGSGSSTGVSIRDILLSYINSNGNKDGVNNSKSETNHNAKVASNNSDSNNPSDAGTTPLTSDSSASPVPYSESSDAGGSKSASKVYELDEKLEPEEFIPSTFYIVLTVLLLIIGLKRKKQFLN